MKNILIVVASFALCFLTSALSSFMVEAKKEVTTHKVLKHLIPHLECAVCDAVVVKAYDKTQELFQERGDLKVNEEDIIEYSLEHLCNPNNKDGHWIRLLDIVVSPLEETGTYKGVFLEPMDDYGQCKRECTTISETCNKLLRSEEADDFSAFLYKNFSEKRLKQRLCKPLCSDKRMEKLIKKSPPKDDWDVERHVTAGKKDMEIETMMDGLTEKAGSNGMPALDVFDRSEMSDLKKAMREGDYDTFSDLDPSGADMSRDDFQTMSLWQQAMEMPEEETEEEAAARARKELEEHKAKEAERKKREEEEAEAERKKKEDEANSSPFGALKSALWG